MYQRDYILRMIEMLGDLIAGILGLIKKGNIQQASQAIENAYYDFLKQDAAFFRNLPVEDLTGVLIQEHNYTNGHLEILAELFYAEAELQYAKGNRTESVEYYKKALALQEFVESESKSFSIDQQSKIKLLRSRISELKTP